MRKIETANEFSQLCAESRAFGENKDCSVKAVALAAGVTYAEAHAAMKAQGRKDRKGAYNDQINKAVESFGKKLVRINLRSKIDQYPGVHKNLRNVTTFHPARFPKAWEDNKTYIAYISGHVLTIINGKTVDWTASRAKQIYAMYEVI